MQKFNEMQAFFKDKFAYLLYDVGSELKYIGMENDTFESNLVLISLRCSGRGYENRRRGSRGQSRGLFRKNRL